MGNASSPTRARNGPHFSVRARPASGREVIEPDLNSKGIKIYMSESNPSPTQLKSIFSHISNDTFTFVK
jgi:hypothetical protein